MSGQSQVPAVVQDYFGTLAPHPVIVQYFRPGVGWKRYPFTKRISTSWARKIRAEFGEGVVLALRSGARTADFSIKECTRSQARARQGVTR